MAVKSAAAKKRREVRKKKLEAKKDPLAPKRITASFDNAFMNLSGDVLLRHFTNKQNHDIYVLFDKKPNLSDDEIRKTFVSSEVEALSSKKVSLIKVGAKKKVISTELVAEKEMQKTVVAKFVNERKKFQF